MTGSLRALGLVLLAFAPAIAASDDVACRAHLGARARGAVVKALAREGACVADGSSCAAPNLERRLGRFATRCPNAAGVSARFPGGDPVTALSAALAAEVGATYYALDPSPAALDGRDRVCRLAVARTFARMVRAAMTEVTKCQEGFDRTARRLLPLHWLCADPVLPEAVVLGRHLAKRCRRTTPAAAGTCATLPDCVADAARDAGARLAALAFGGVPGTSAAIDLAGDVARSDTFWNLPYPSDLRLRADGTPDLTGYPAPEGNALVASYRAVAERRPRFPTVAVGYFRFDAPLVSRDVDATIPAATDAPLLLVDVDPSSPERGRLFPLVAQTLGTTLADGRRDPWVTPHLLAVGALPGTILPAGRTFAFVVRRGLGDATGAPLGVPFAFAHLAARGTPPGARGTAARALYTPLWETLAQLDIPRDDVAAATVFTTGDVVAEVAALASAVRARDPVEIGGVTLDEVHPRFCELRGQVTLPRYQRGTPPYDTLGDFVPGADGLPLQQGNEIAPVVITLPRQPMPAGGYPLTMYLHGSAGLAAQVVDRGPVVVSGGDPTPGEGPAHVLAAHGIATAGPAMPLNPERLPDAAHRAYLNLVNLGAYPSTFRQGAIEQTLLLDALARLSIDPGVVAACAGPTLPPGESAFRLRTDAVGMMGQSMGAQYTNMAAAIDARVGAAMPTGSGGLWSLVILIATIEGGVATGPLVPAVLPAATPVRFLHPGLQLLETAWEWAETAVYARRLARDPLPQHPARGVFLPVAIDDPGFPNDIYTAMALASATQQAGDAIYPGLQTALATAGLADLAPYPVEANVASITGAPYTGVVAQYAADGILDGHHIFAQLDVVKHQYGCFFASFHASGTPVVPAPAASGTPCP